MPKRILVDADGYVWRDFGEGFLSMAPSNPDNEPLPEPVAVYMPSLPDARRIERIEGEEDPSYQCPACGVSFEVGSWTSGRVFCSPDCKDALGKDGS